MAFVGSAGALRRPRCDRRSSVTCSALAEAPRWKTTLWSLATATAVSVAVFVGGGAPPACADTESIKVNSGAASTGFSGSRKIVTRGVDLSNFNFSGQDLHGVSFQQSILRGANFSKANLMSASFFDADLSDCNFEGANMVQANLELANLRNANLKDARLENAYVVGSTKLNGVKIDGADFTDVFFRKDQQNYLCSIASGANSLTEVPTKESLMCKQ